jgi:hypothetical protein
MVIHVPNFFSISRGQRSNSHEKGKPRSEYYSASSLGQKPSRSWCPFRRRARPKASPQKARRGKAYVLRKNKEAARARRGRKRMSQTLPRGPHLPHTSYPIPYALPHLSTVSSRRSSYGVQTARPRIRCVYIYIYDTYKYTAALSAQPDASWPYTCPPVRLPLAGGARRAVSGSNFEIRRRGERARWLGLFFGK